MNYMLIMKNSRSGLMAIGPVSIEYQAAMLRDELEESSDWTTLGIARVLNEKQARAAIGAAERQESDTAAPASQESDTAKR